MAALVLVAMTTSGCSSASERPETASDLAQEVRKANLQKLTAALLSLQEEGGRGNFAIFRAGGYRVQFAGRRGWTSFYAEANNTDSLPPERALSPEQVERLQALGWGHQRCAVAVKTELPTTDFCRTDWDAPTDEDRAAMADVVLRTFTEGYGVPPDVPLEVEVVLE